MRAWADRNAAAAARHARVRAELTAFAEENAVPLENLITPDVLRRVLWSPPSPEQVDDELARRGARPWQVDIVAPLTRASLAEHPDP